ncbi:hypothetical protein HMPREF9603_00797 [Cutibacterium acnes HL001PA1]|nr:hypothetical protein HMPREF9603_00797 [Cutibacterium acnes HL001PA1]
MSASASLTVVGFGGQNEPRHRWSTVDTGVMPGVRSRVLVDVDTPMRSGPFGPVA